MEEPDSGLPSGRFRGDTNGLAFSPCGVAAAHDRKRGRRSGTYAAPPLVLLVDDNDDSREICAAHLRLGGFRVEQAANGEIALTKALETNPAIIVLDYHMPIMDGLETARRLKEDRRTMGTPLVLLTSFVPDQGACPDFEHELEKPCLPEKLVAVIHETLSASGWG